MREKTAERERAEVTPVGWQGSEAQVVCYPLIEEKSVFRDTL